MEDDKGNFLVIATGYTEEMKDFLISNPGMKSRFTREIIFEDYTPDELLEISKKYVEQKGHIFKPDIEYILKRKTSKKSYRQNT